MHDRGPEPWTAGEVISRDGTPLRYRRYGARGPAVVLVHGGGQAAQNLHRLAVALADAFVVYVPDRRGRGGSGPPGAGYGLAAERDDLAALVEHSGAVHLFGLSSGGILVLSAARALRGIRSVAVYEPPLSINHSTPLGWLPRYERELARGQVGAAAVTAMRGTRTAGPALRLVPRPLVTLALNAATREAGDGTSATGDGERRRAVAHGAQRDRVDAAGAGVSPALAGRSAVVRTLAGVLLWPLRAASRAGERSPAPEVPLRALVPTMRYDARLVAESEGTLQDHAALSVPVLLMGGSRSARYLSRTLDALQRVLPESTRVELPKVGHVAPDDTGKPLCVAEQLRRFWDSHAG